MSLDAVIVGAGAAGLLTALRAASLGARVALLDVAAGARSNMAVSGGMFAGAGTRFQIAAGIEDSPALFAADVRRKTEGAVDAVILDAVAARSADAAHFIADDLGLALRIAGGVDFAGHSVPRLHATDAQDGKSLAGFLVDATRRTEAISLHDATEAIGLVVVDGVVRGVTTATGEQILAKLTVLASAGFAANPAMVARWRRRYRLRSISAAARMTVARSTGAPHWARSCCSWTATRVRGMSPQTASAGSGRAPHRWARSW